MFCPICKAEYRDGFTKCAECGCALADRLDEPEKEDIRLVYLANVEDGPAGEARLGILRAYGIPYERRYRSESAMAKIYFGNSAMGVEIYVRDYDLPTAKELLGI